jgi:hypothetical protein
VHSLLTMALNGVSGQLHAPAALHPSGKSSLYPFSRKLGEPQSWSGYFGEVMTLDPARNIT